MQDVYKMVRFISIGVLTWTFSLQWGHTEWTGASWPSKVYNFAPVATSHTYEEQKLVTKQSFFFYD